MSQFDHGKHPHYTDSDGFTTDEKIPNSKRLDAQREPRGLAARRADFGQFKTALDAKVRGGYNRPGSQNRNK